MVRTRNDEIRQIHTEYRNFYRLLGGGALVAVGVVIGAVLFAGDAPALTDITGYFTNLYTEAVSVILTISVLNYLQERREERRRERDLQEQLVREAGSPIRETAVTAVDTIRKRGWLYGEGRKQNTDAILRDADLSFCDLSNADLRGADLTNANLFESKFNSTNLGLAIFSGANLMRADLRGARLLDTRLNNAKLEFANLSGTNLYHSDVNDADLRSADLCDADLRFTDFRGGDLLDANLRNARMESADLRNTRLISANLNGALIDQSTKLDETTVLPDGENWSPEHDLSNFGAETRKIISMGGELAGENHIIIYYTFADGVTRRWQQGKGWLDDRDGNPIT